MNKKQRSIMLGRKPKRRHSIKQGEIIYGDIRFQPLYKAFCFNALIEEMMCKIFVGLGVPSNLLKNDYGRYAS